MTTHSSVLREILGRAETARLLSRLRARLERGRPLTGLLVLTEASAAERDSISRLLGRVPTVGSSISIPLELLEEKLRNAGHCKTLAEAVEHLTGPVINRRAIQKNLETQWNALFAATSEHITSNPKLINWLDAIRTTGMLRRYGIEKGEQLLTQALAVISQLPANGIFLAELAAASTGDAHALDINRPLSTVVIRAAATLAGIERWDDSESRRDIWAAVGVLMDELSAPVLVLNLRPVDDSPTSRCLRIYADAGEPCFVSIRQLLRTPPVFSTTSTGNTIFVCENKNIVAAAAARLGKACAPFVCTDGQPKTALRVLLTQLTAAGIQLRYHGDFDWPGIQIANTIILRHGAQPWQMSTGDYLSAATGNLTLQGQPVAPIWDTELQSAMEQTGRVVHEEQTFDKLLQDLVSR